MTPELRARYAEPHRRYHTATHIDDCLARLAEIADPGEAAQRVLTWAIWWHDAIYDPTRADNEAASAELARRDLPDLGASPAEVDEVARLILLTAGHSVAAGDRLGALMVSIDLSILGAAPAIYDAYAAAVRAEYAHVPAPAFRAGRSAVLQRFLAAPAIFAYPGFAARFEAAARANLARELATLT
ncbi:phosphohydrolase [Caulobacter sp. KR2-114]|uniref:HD domain-containing protein n=1 Tax=Caulobacter sp. KR2-114 TaxID=3400912 RepID=UPI003C002963